MVNVIVIANNIRSTHNIGSIFRTCDGFGVKELILSGYTPYPEIPNDSRLPHLYKDMTNKINKSALGAQNSVSFRYEPTINLSRLKKLGYEIVGLEQSSKSIPLTDYEPNEKIVLLLGEERYGIEEDILDQCDHIIEIPMLGQKESFNVSVAAGIALYHIVYS